MNCLPTAAAVAPLHTPAQRSTWHTHVGIHMSNDDSHLICQWCVLTVWDGFLARLLSYGLAEYIYILYIYIYIYFSDCETS